MNIFGRIYYIIGDDEVKKVLVILFGFIMLAGFSFPQDIGLIIVDDLETTQFFLANYFELDGSYEYTESDFPDGTKYYNYALGNVSITMQQDNKTIQDVTIGDLTEVQARQLLNNLGVAPDFFGEQTLLMSEDFISNLYITQDKAVALRNTAKFPLLYNDEKYLIINVVFTEERVQDFLDGQVSDLLGTYSNNKDLK